MNNDLISREEIRKCITRLSAIKGSNITLLDILYEISNIPAALKLEDIEAGLKEESYEVEWNNQTDGIIIDLDDAIKVVRELFAQ